jgi:hypothetical protein
MENSRGGKPRPNSSTFTPEALAVIKCPSSWAIIIITIMPIADNMAVSIDDFL